MFKRVLGLAALVFALLAGIGVVGFMQWRTQWIEPERVREASRFEIWSTLAVGRPVIEDIRWESFSMDKGSQTFRGKLRFPRTPFTIGPTDVPGPTGECEVDVTGRYITRETPAANPLGLPLTRLIISEVIPETAVDPRLSGGEESERWWKERQTSNELYDAGLGLPRNPMLPSFDRPFRLFNIFAARHFRREGKWDPAARALSYANGFNGNTSNLLPIWAERLTEEYRLVRIRSRE